MINLKSVAFNEDAHDPPTNLLPINLTRGVLLSTPRLLRVGQGPSYVSRETLRPAQSEVYRFSESG